MGEGKYQNAQPLFEALGDYSDSKNQAELCIYYQAEALYENEIVYGTKARQMNEAF